MLSVLQWKQRNTVFPLFILGLCLPEIQSIESNFLAEQR